MFAEWFTSKALSPVAAKLATTIFEKWKDPTSRKVDEWKVTLQFGFDNYFRKEIERYSNIKTILGANAPLNISDIYVNLYVHISQERVMKTAYARALAVRDDDLVSDADKKRRIVITGTAGAGKSMLMKYLFLQTLSVADHRLPVFVELRELNENPKTTLLEYVQKKISDHIVSFTLDQTKFAVKEGIISLFLDGLDEIDFDRKIERSKEIVQLGHQYDKCVIYVSSRPDDIFRSWERFHVYNVMQLSVSQIKLLVSKIPYDAEIKSLFLKKLDSGLFESHKEFLVNPLLVIMMIITLEQFAEIPAKIHLFYEYAFEALFARHDSTKSGGFQRKRQVNLALDDYRRLFSYFCAISYLKETFRFTHQSILELLSRSISASQIEVKKEDMLEDLIKCTCMISKDGLDYIFSHRSFQEYFVSYFVARVKSEEMGQVVPKLISRSRSDSVIMMMAEMNRERFEESWALPKLREICGAIQEINPEKKVLNYVEKFNGVKSPPIIFDVEHQEQENSSIHVAIYRTKSGHTLSDARYVFARVYDIILKVIQRCESSGSDRDILKEIFSGKHPFSDARFNVLREGEKSNKNEFGYRMFEIKSKRSDNIWLARTQYAKRAGIEKELLFELLNEIESRVAARNDGLADILGLKD